jgi:predicted DNA-binding transcriptional regulator AlpA
MTNALTPKPTLVFTDEERLVPRRWLRQTVPVSDMTIWRWERDGSFPRHLNIHGRNYWLHNEVMEWIARQKRGKHAGNGKSD